MNNILNDQNKKVIYKSSITVYKNQRNVGMYRLTKSTNKRTVSCSDKVHKTRIELACSNITHLNGYIDNNTTFAAM